MIARNIVWVIAPFLFLFIPKTIAWLPLILGMLAWRTRDLNQGPKWICASVPLWFSFLALLSIMWAAFPDQQFDLFIDRLRGISIACASIIFLSVTPVGNFRTFYSSWRVVVPFVYIVFLMIALNPYMDIKWAEFNRMFITIAILNIVTLMYYIDHTKLRSAVFLYALSSFVLMYSEASAALLVTLISLPLLLLCVRHFRVMRWILMVGCPLIIMIFPFIMPFIWENTRSLDILDNASTGGRLEIWYGLSKVIVQNWGLGWGYEITRFIHLPIDNVFYPDARAVHPHNLSIQAWVEYGIVGAIAMASIWFQLMRTAKSPVMLVTLVGLFIIGCLSYSVWKNIWLLFCIFAYFYARAYQKSETSAFGNKIQ